MAVYTDVAVEELAAFLGPYDLGDLLAYKGIAEGVENREAWEKLVTLGCDLAQGHYLCPPMPPTDLTRWFRDSDLGPSVQVSKAG